MPPNAIDAKVDFHKPSRFVVTQHDESSLYSDRQDLPWHFSFIDSDRMVAGFAAPTERENWRALRELNFGLIVNLTEHKILPISEQAATTHSVSCSKCLEMTFHPYADDIFHDLETDDDMQVLFLPIRDGSIPRYEQLDVFLKHARETIARGKRVGVHCQAGIGRTGVFLSIYLMEKYFLETMPKPEWSLQSSGDIIRFLRHARPQSLQFHRTDWQTKTFMHCPADDYVRNYLQEGYILKYFRDRIEPKLKRDACGTTFSSLLSTNPWDEEEDDSGVDLESPIHLKAGNNNDIKNRHDFLWDHHDPLYQIDDSLRELVIQELSTRLDQYDEIDKLEKERLRKVEERREELRRLYARPARSSWPSSSGKAVVDNHLNHDEVSSGDIDTSHDDVIDLILMEDLELTPPCAVCRGVISEGPFYIVK